MQNIFDNLKSDEFDDVIFFIYFIFVLWLIIQVTTDIKLVDPADLQPTEFEWRFTEEGKKVRISLRTGREIPIPTSNDETYDYKSKKGYYEREKDTKAADAETITFYPKLKTFEMEIMEEMGIKEDRVPAKTFWYW